MVLHNPEEILKMCITGVSFGVLKKCLSSGLLSFTLSSIFWFHVSQLEMALIDITYIILVEIGQWGAQKLLESCCDTPQALYHPGSKVVCCL